MKTAIVVAGALALGLGSPAVAGNANLQTPPGGDYQAVSGLVPLPDFIPGLGSLYVDPATLPAGPFAAYDRTGTLVSTIYMIPLAQMQAQQSFEGLAVAGEAVQTVTLHYNAGHPGVDLPHYHIILWHVAPQDAALD